MMTFKNKFKLLILILVTVFICNVGVRLLIIDEQVNRISTLQKVVSDAGKGSGNRSDRDVPGISKSKDDVDLILSEIPGEVRITEYTSQIGKLVEKNHLMIERSLVFRSERNKYEDLVKYKTEIIVFGDYQRIKKLIADLQNLPGVAYLSSADFSRTLEGSEEIKLKVGYTVFFKKGDYET